jgi:hypothetical protein
MLAKLHQPEVDPRKPYTEIGGADCFSGRRYDEQYLTPFLQANRLPCNSTTAFLTPALRNIGRSLTTDVVLLGKPPELYAQALEVLGDVAEGRESAEAVLLDSLRILVQMRDEQAERLIQLRNEIRVSRGSVALSAESIVRLIRQHLECKHSSRLPVLLITAAYQAAFDGWDESPRPLHSHNAADVQTGSLGDVEILLKNDDRVCTVYEMKQRRVTTTDLEHAVQKMLDLPSKIDNYVFITTELIEDSVTTHATILYDKTGIEFVVLDCLNFVRHFLHLFHRRRIAFLDAYETLVLAEPESAVGSPLKEAFLTLRRAALVMME